DPPPDKVLAGNLEIAQRLDVGRAGRMSREGDAVLLAPLREGFVIGLVQPFVERALIVAANGGGAVPDVLKQGGQPFQQRVAAALLEVSFKTGRPGLEPAAMSATQHARLVGKHTDDRFA